MSARRQNTNQRNRKATRNRPRRQQRIAHTVGVMAPKVQPFMRDNQVNKYTMKFFVPQVTTDATGNLLHRFSIRNVTRAFDGAGTYSNSSPSAQSFDCYKPLEFRIRTIPVGVPDNYPLASFVLCLDNEDNDTSQVVASNQDAFAYNPSFPLNPRDTTYTVFPVPSLSAGTIPGTLSTAPAAILAGGYLDYNAPPFEGVVYMVGGNFPANYPVMDVYLELDVLTKYAR